MAKKMADLGIVQITQDFLPEHWKWSDTEKKMLGNLEEMGKIIKSKLENAGCEIEEMYAVKHDKDEKKLWNEYKHTYEIAFTSHHAHFVVKFKKGKTLPEIASAVGVEESYIEKPKSGRYSYDNMLSYLIHIKYPQKYQYEPGSVWTVTGKNYMEHYGERREAWMRGRAEKITANAKGLLNFLKIGILNGEITHEDLFMDKEWKLTYALHKNMFDGLFQRKFLIEQMEENFQRTGKCLRH
ncbi:Rep family protein [Lachnospiraceae bacterium 46-15]